MGYGNPIVAANPHPGPPIGSPGLSSFIFHLSIVRSFNLSSSQKFNLSFFHLQSAIRLFQKNQPVWTSEPFMHAWIRDSIGTQTTFNANTEVR